MISTTRTISTIMSTYMYYAHVYVESASYNVCMHNKLTVRLRRVILLNIISCDTSVPSLSEVTSPWD